MLVDTLKQNGVNVEGCLFDRNARTGLAFLTLKHNGEREFTFYRNTSADMLLTEAEKLLLRAKIFHYGSISLTSEPCRSAFLAAMRVIKAVGILCSYDPNVRPTLWPSEDAARSGILSIWKEADFIKVSDEEVAFLTQGDPTDERNVLSLWFDGLKLLVVTDGVMEKRDADTSPSVPGFKVNTVDTTGAGYAFVGSLLFNIAKDDSILHDDEKLREVLKFSNICLRGHLHNPDGAHLGTAHHHCCSGVHQQLQLDATELVISLNMLSKFPTCDH
ncbi:hypothetical protein EJB05_27706, partial [Eragrostis curvula]